MEDHEQWQWQQQGTTWKGAGLYHVTLTVTDRQPCLGTLVIPGNDPAAAYVRRTPLGDALVDCLLSIPAHYPEVQPLHFCLMPDHLHAVLYVRRTMPKGIGSVVRGFWQAAKKLGRASTLFPPDPASGPSVPSPSVLSPSVPGPSSVPSPSVPGPSSVPSPSVPGPSSVGPNIIRANPEEGAAAVPSASSAPEGLKEASLRLERFSASLCEQLGKDAYCSLAPLFTEMPFLRPMTRRSQLPTTLRYIDMNPQRLATKRLRPGFFRVQTSIAIGPRSYDGVGNAALLMAGRYAPVHVRSHWVNLAQHGNTQPLRDYMNACVLQARQGVVLVSPFISPQEKQVQQVLLRERHPFISLADNGFRDYYKPADTLFDACAEGRLLILSPWPYDAGKRHISRTDCVTLNHLAEEICDALNS